MDAAHPTLTVALALGVGVLAQSVARRLRIPGIVVLLAVGAGLGPEGLGWVRPRDLGEGLYAIVDLAVAIILFEGGLNLQISRLRRAQVAIQRLVTVGALVSLAGGAVAAHTFLDWPWTTSLLFGSLIIVTGPTVIGPLVSELRLRPRVATVLSAEGVLIDPIGAIVAVLTLELVLSPGADNLAQGAGELMLRLGFGALAGVAGGYLLTRLMRIERLLPEGHENIFVLASVLLLFEGCEQVVSHSGIMAVTLAGVVVGNLRILGDRDLREFKDQLTVLLIGLLFVLLAADVGLEQVRDLGWAGVATVAALVLVVRPVGVWLSTIGGSLSTRERAFVAWVAPRGIVAAAIASLVARALEVEQIPGGLEIRALVFLTIASTVVLAGLTAGPVANLLDVRQPRRDAVAILGADEVGLALARWLREGGITCTFLDSNPQNCRRAEEDGFGVVYGNAMEERTLRRARFDLVGTAIALTPNQTVNSAFIHRTRDLFRVPKALVAVSRLDTGLASDLVAQKEASIAFDGPHDLARWNVRFRREAVVLETREYAPADGETENENGEEALGERAMLLAIRRRESVIPMSRDLRPQAGDRLLVAIHEPDRDEVDALLVLRGWMSLPDEAEPPDAEDASAPAASA
ncbi:MAG: cation:proton antiporter [Myxococcota bacterium]